MGNKVTKELIIEEGIYNIDTKKSICKLTIRFDGTKFTRELYHINDTKRRNEYIDIFDKFHLSVKDINNLSITEIGLKMKKKSDDFWELISTEEQRSFKYPIILKEKYV